MVKIVQRGDLHRKAKQKSLFNDLLWISSIGDFEDVQVITLSQWAKERAYEQAWYDADNISCVHDRASKLLHTVYHRVQEFVNISQEGKIIVGVNASRLDDSLAAERAIELLSNLESCTVCGHYTFGEWVYLYDSTSDNCKR
jgi:hypothetical protein